jgi:crotonobetainyl-CoA:carnitine CoA-transferase CaiB-like acyl-CoA transferase
MTPENGEQLAPALHGIKVIDASILFAGPLAATLLGDFGADVLKIEMPGRGDPARYHGESKDGIGLWWKMLSRNKKLISLYLGSVEGQDIFRKLIRDADVVIENFRPGTLERWGLGYEQLRAENPRLVLARVTGFGQSGPMAHLPGFGTLAEAMSGFAHVNGEPEGPPTLPPFALADGITALATAFGILTALRSRDISGVGQVIDIALIEPILSLLGPQAAAYRALGVIPRRLGSRTDTTAPRNVYQARDGNWLAVSTSSPVIAERLMQLIGHPHFIMEPWFASGEGRAQHADELDAVVNHWIGQRDSADVLTAFGEAGVAVAPILDIAGIWNHPQYQALQSLIEVPDEELGEVAMPNIMMRMSETPGAIRWTGGRLGRDNEEVLTGIGLSIEDLERLRSQGVM